MTKTTVLILFLIVVLAFGAGYVLKGETTDVGESPSPRPSVSSAQLNPSPAQPVSYTIRLTASGPNPKRLTIHAGDSVTFVGEDPSGTYWPYSVQCSGLDTRRALGYGDQYALTFTAVGTCAYYDRQQPEANAAAGTIIIQ